VKLQNLFESSGTLDFSNLTDVTKYYGNTKSSEIVAYNASDNFGADSFEFSNPGEHPYVLWGPADSNFPNKHAVGLIGSIIASAFIPKAINVRVSEVKISPEQISNREELEDKLNHLATLGGKASRYADVDDRTPEDEKFLKSQGHLDEIADQREETLDEFKYAAKDIAKFLINVCGFHMKVILGSKNMAGVSKLVDDIYEMHNQSKVHAKTLMHHLEKAPTEKTASSWHTILNYIENRRLTSLSAIESELLTSGMLTHLFKTDSVLKPTILQSVFNDLKNMHLVANAFYVQSDVSHFQADKICKFLHPDDKDRIAEQLKKISGSVIKTCQETKKTDTDIIIFSDADHVGLKVIMHLDKWYQECGGENELPCVPYLKTLMSSQYHFLNDYLRTSGVHIQGARIPSGYTRLIARVISNLSDLSG
jgi:hypothetical protein